ncbi:uncharacterized protein [Panulirus ornatus]|uniref:uncharacterized protein n=1 Tax=Panulirus ornatus TaxID=150431 RepID=UPI003A83F5A3
MGVRAWEAVLLARVVPARSSRVGGGGVWAWAVVVLASVVSADATRTNVVAEVPSLDVGPLVGVTVARGDVARLPCRHPHYPDDTLNLVLWYLNHTTRPFLSYDTRATLDTNATTTTVSSNSISSLGHSSGEESKERRFLESGGTTLVIRGVREDDHAEYRCRVHFRLSPTWTQRLLLLVPEAVEGVTLQDASGKVVRERLEPLAEGDNLTLTCHASHGSMSVVSLIWLLEGRELDSTWASAGEGVVVNQLQIVGVEQGLRGAHLACRLTTVTDSDHTHTAANITYRSAIIAMFYVPEASLGAEGGRAGTAGGGREVQEGEGVTLLCSVRADPPVYNITWLHNGRILSVGGRRWMRDNASLVISPVSRGDAGLYTCLASNREGDGHSNAVLIRVTHPPYCTGSPESHLVVPSNTSVTLTCRVEAVPMDLKFTWKVGSPALQQGQGKVPPPPRHSGHLASARILADQGGRATTLQQAKDPPAFWCQPSPALLVGAGEAVAPGPGAGEHQQDSPWNDSQQILQTKQDGEVKGRRDPSHPNQSTLTLTPSASTVVGCYARNSVGHIKVPCTYSLTVVEQPKALRECRVTLVGVARLKVKCEDPAHYTPAHHAQPGVDPTHPQHSPSLSFVRSPEASSRANLEVWSGETLVANVSEGRPQFSVRGLPPATDLRLVLYTATPHARSTPLYMYTRTLPRTVVHFTVPPPTRPKPPEPETIPPTLLEALGWQVVGGVGGVGLVLLLVLSAGVRAWTRRRARAAAAAAAGENSSTNSQEQQLHQQQSHHASLITTTSDESIWGPEWRSSSM